MFITEDKGKLAGALRSLPASELAIVSIDGYDLVGKSTLADYLSTELGFVSIELDDFWGADRTVDHARLKAAIAQPRDTAKVGYLVNGVMALHDLDQAGLAPTHKIYVKGMKKSSGEWAHKGWTSASTEEIDHAHKEGVPIGPVYPHTLLVRCAEYHRKYSPHLSADSILENHIW